MQTQQQPRYMQGVGGDYSAYQSISAGPFVGKPTNYADQWGSPWQAQRQFGADAVPFYQSTTYQTVRWLGGVLGAGLGAYHGYKRHGESVGWSIGWFLLGGIFWPIAIPIMFIQGVGKTKYETKVVANRGRRRLRHRRRAK